MQVEHPLDQGDHLIVLGHVVGVVEVGGADGEATDPLLPAQIIRITERPLFDHRGNDVSRALERKKILPQGIGNQIQDYIGIDQDRHA